MPACPESSSPNVTASPPPASSCCISFRESSAASLVCWTIWPASGTSCAMRRPSRALHRAMQIPAGTISFKFIFMYLFFRYGDQFYHVHQHVTTIARLLVRTEILERKRNGNIRARFHSDIAARSEEHTSELKSLMRISYAVFCLQKKQKHKN